jgi:acyl-CoA reductase-like NAD-dependent aldehyde dehydrogenase
MEQVISLQRISALSKKKKSSVTKYKGTNISDSSLTISSFSPIDQKVVGITTMISKKELNGYFDSLHDIGTFSLNFKNIERLGQNITKNRQKFISQINLETGYTLQDSKNIVSAAIEFLTDFRKYYQDIPPLEITSRFTYNDYSKRKLKLKQRPYGLISSMTPQNAPLILELIVICNSLATGNNIILRPSTKNIGTIMLLEKTLLQSFDQDLLNHVHIVYCDAVDFLKLSYQKADLIHYIGSSTHGKKILSEAMNHNVKAIVDGEGNSTVVIEKSADITAAIEKCRDGIIRANGQLCSTIRTIIVEETIYDKFSKGLVAELNKVKIGDARVQDTEMGPLFHPKQVDALLNLTQNYRLISGSNKSLSQGSNYITPLLCELESDDIQFMSELVYGPITGLVKYSGADWKKWLQNSPYLLNDVVFSNNEEFIEEFIKTSHSTRIVINNDPSMESVFEPWGGFLPSGSDDVSHWKFKYLQTYQVDSED